MKRHLSIALKLAVLRAAAFVLAACTMQASPVDAPDFAGEYTLIAVSGKPVPANIIHGRSKMEVRSGTFTINADGSCSSKTVFVPPSGTEIAREVSATYTRNGSKLTMQWKGAGKTIGTIEGSTFSMDNEGTMFTYKKQMKRP